MWKNKLLLLAISLFAFAGLACAQGDIVFDDFESANYSPKWTVEGEAFGSAPAKGGFPYQLKVCEYGGTYLVNSYFNKDGTTGKMRSVEFKIERKYLKCLVGGGNNPKDLYLRVLVDGREVSRITGVNSERLEPRAIDLSSYQGKTAVIEIVDNATGGWGHINIDDIIFTNEVPECPFGENRIEIKNAKRYLCFPINKNAPRRRVQISSAKGILFNGNMNIDFTAPTKMVYFSTREHIGQDLTLLFPQVLGEKIEIKMADKMVLKDYPNELLRPQYHFSSPQGWLNDPNGMVYWKGKWHMYYQALPYQVADRDGHKSWGHAISADLMNWQVMPMAIAPKFDDNGREHAIWSGSGFADTKNRSGLFDKNGGLIFSHTFTGKGDYVAYSKDGMFPITFDTPITTAKGRDPCIFYHEPTKKWVVLRYEEVYSPELKKDLRKFAFYNSKDLKEWTRTQILDDFYECPYIMQMAVEGSKGEKKYLIFDASGECVIGDFDGEIFTPSSNKRAPKFLLGSAYAGQIFHNAPKGRAVNMSWLRAPHEDFLQADMPFAEMMTLPMDLRLEKRDGAYRVFAKLSPEVEKYFGNVLFEQSTPRVLGKDEVIEIKNLPSAYVVECELDVSNAKDALFKILGALNVAYDKKENAYRFSRLPMEERTTKTKDLRWPGIHFNMQDKSENNRVKFKMFIDRMSIEVFHSDTQVIAVYVPFGDETQTLRIMGENLKIENLKVRAIKPAVNRDDLRAL